MNEIYLLANDVGGDTSTIEKTEIGVEKLKKVMSELGISSFSEEPYKLILFNDDVNSMEHVTESLITICKMTMEEAVSYMLEAHLKGKSVIKTGEYDEMINMKDGLNKRLINASIEK